LTKYAVRVAKENDGEINILRVITVPHQTPLSAGSAFTERAAKDFEPLERIIDKENIPNHYFVRISHDANEAILSTIEEQRIDLLITDYETLRRNKALQTLATCNMLAILTGGVSDEELALEDSIAKKEYQGLEENEDGRKRKKSLVVLYDGGDHSDMVLKTASWLEHSGRFNTTILSIKKKEEGKHIGYSRIDSQDIRYEKDKEKEKHVKYLEQIGVEFREVFVSDLAQNNSQRFCRLILSSINASQPDLLVTGKRIGKFSVFENEHFVSLLEGLNCPVIIARSFVIPGLSKIRSILMKAVHHS
jgi:APA family basic amino acid/polyamine antiporter